MIGLTVNQKNTFSSRLMWWNSRVSQVSSKPPFNTAWIQWQGWRKLLHNWLRQLRSWRRRSVDAMIGCCLPVLIMRLGRRKRWWKSQRRKKKTASSMRPILHQRVPIQPCQVLGVVPNLPLLPANHLLRRIPILRPMQSFVQRNWRLILKRFWKRWRRIWR